MMIPRAKTQNTIKKTLTASFAFDSQGFIGNANLLRLATLAYDFGSAVSQAKANQHYQSTPNRCTAANRAVTPSGRIIGRRRRLLPLNTE